MTRPRLSESYVTQAGHLTGAGHERLTKLRDDINAVLSGDHADNCGELSRCRIDLNGHDCCQICNDVESALGSVAWVWIDGDK